MTTAAKQKSEPAIKWRPYQRDVFFDRTTGVFVLLWSRQIGKSFSLAGWAIDRLLSRPGRLITVLSNSRDNGGEFVVKCNEICEMMRLKMETVDQSPDLQFENMRFEVRITIKGRVSRIKVLAANPRTARGFSGDLILDEFAFHENSQAIWEAAEPILSSNPDYLCRIASTANGKYNMFYQMVQGAVPIDGRPNLYTTQAGFVLSKIPRTEAYRQGVKIYDPATRALLTPEQARAKSLDKRAYDQNYECVFADENMTLLTHELISAAEDPLAGIICDQDWTPSAIALMRRAIGQLYVGVDVARNRDLTVVSVIEKLGHLHVVRAILRIQDMRLPEQQLRLGAVCSMPKFARCKIDMTGLGIGLCEYSQNAYGFSRISGVNFGSTVPITHRILLEGRKRETVRVTEALATELLQVYEDRAIQHPSDMQLREDLRKPERITSPSGQVSIAAVRDGGGHADHFWSFALAVEAGKAGGSVVCKPVESRFQTMRSTRRTKGVLV